MPSFSQALLLLSCAVLAACASRPAGPPQQPMMQPVAAAPAHQPPPLPLQAPVQAPWRQGAARSQSLAGGATLHDLQVSSAEGAAEVRVIIFDSRRLALRVLDQPAPNAGGGVLPQLMRQVGAVAGVNGGFFHPDFQPLGQFIAAGRRHGQFTSASRLVSGSLTVVNGEPYLVWNAEYRGDQGVSDMVQAGPRLVDGGRPLAGLNRTKPAARTFIATDGGRTWAVGVVRHSTLGGLADLLATQGLLPGLQVQRALNLDGGRSTAFYARTSSGQEISQPGWSTVRNYLALVPR